MKTFQIWYLQKYIIRFVNLSERIALLGDNMLLNSLASASQPAKCKVHNSVASLFQLAKYRSIAFCSLMMIILLSISSCCNYESSTKKQLDAFFDHLEKHDMGFGSVSIFSQEMEVYNRQIGFSDLERKKRNNKNTRFRIGSISKTFTAVAIFQMIEEDKLHLDTTLDLYFPAVKNSENITIKHLLQHQSGIFNLTNDDTYPEWMLLPTTNEKLLERISSYEPLFEAGEREEYSNSNYTLLALIMEKIDGDTYKNIIQNRILTPLKLKNTQASGSIKSHKNNAKSYYKLQEWLQMPETDESILIGSGGMISTPSDLTVFFHSLFHGQLLTPETVEMMKPTDTIFGLGLFTIPFYEDISYGHSGGIDGFQSVAGHFPDKNITFSYISNGVAFPHNDVVIGVLSILSGREYEFPVFSDGMVIEIEILERYVGIYNSPDLPIEIAIFIENGQMMAQGTGQSAFPLTAEDEVTFTFATAHIKMIFDVENSTIDYTQGAFHTIFSKVNEDIEDIEILND